MQLLGLGMQDVGGRALEPEVLKIGPGHSISFEERCAELERKFAEMDLVCSCCTNELHSACPACRGSVLSPSQTGGL